MKYKEGLFLAEHIAFRMGGVPMRWAHRAAASQAAMLPGEQLHLHNHSTVTFSQELLYPQPSGGRERTLVGSRFRQCCPRCCSLPPLLTARQSVTTVLAGVGAHPSTTVTSYIPLPTNDV